MNTGLAQAHQVSRGRLRRQSIPLEPFLESYQRFLKERAAMVLAGMQTLV